MPHFHIPKEGTFEYDQWLSDALAAGRDLRGSPRVVQPKPDQSPKASPSANGEPVVQGKNESWDRYFKRWRNSPAGRSAYTSEAVAARDALVDQSYAEMCPSGPQIRAHVAQCAIKILGGRS